MASAKIQNVNAVVLLSGYVGLATILSGVTLCLAVLVLEPGNTPLLIAAAKGHGDVVKALLVRSPDLDVQNTAGDTALISASRGGYADICRMLLAAGANRQLRNGAGVAAADVATGRGFETIAKDLGKG